MTMTPLSRFLPILLLAGLPLLPNSTVAYSIEHPDIARIWSRLDGPVLSGAATRTWFWGPDALTALMHEPYIDAPNGQRWVQYFDKSRMEINEAADAGSPWRVTSGLLATELVTGRLQLGDDAFADHEPADINVAGDLDDPNGPTYRSLNGLLDGPGLPEGTVITQTVDRHGQVGENQGYADYGVTAAKHVSETGHTVASVFWEHMNRSGTVHVDGQNQNGPLFENPYYATGYPLTEAYWARIRVAGVEQPVLIQIFERRVLTYTPNNPNGWKVEAGNVGRHHLMWRSNLEDTGLITIPPTPENGNTSDDGCDQWSENVTDNSTVKQSNSATIKQTGGNNNNQTVTCTQKNTSTQKQ